MSAATALPANRPPHLPRGRRRHPWPRLSRLLARLLTAWLVGSGTWVTLAVAQPAPPAALTLPSGGQVVGGGGAIQRNGAQMVVQQSTPRLGIDWASFSIGAGASVEFRQPDAGSVALNRVIGNEASQIYGRLTANGQVFLTNPNGVLFARGAKVDVGGLVASTLDLTQDDFAAGRYRFGGASNASVVNEGTVGTSAGGYLVLLGQQVENAGEISVPSGQVVLASGRAATVSISGSGLLSAVVDPATSAGSVLNSGQMTAEGGSVRLSAHSAEALAGSLVNNTGIVKANSIVERNGEIWITGDHVANSGRLEASAPAGGDGGRIMLMADMARGRADVAGTIDASSAQGRGGFVETSAARVAVADGARVTTLAPEGRAGTWLIDPNDYTVAASGGNITGATLSASLAGGHVTISTVTQGTAGGNGDIFINDTVAWSAHTLTLSAERHISINSAMTGSGTATLTLEYGQGSVAAGNAGRYMVGAPVGLPSGNSLATKLGSDGTLASYNVVTTLADLQAIDDRTGGNAAIASRLAANYALGADIDASSTATANGGAGFDPIGAQSTASAGALNSFGGRFEGLGHTISGLTVNRPADTAGGLFANTQNAVIRNLTLTGSTITGGGYVGTLVGVGNGTTSLDNVASTSAVVSSAASSARVGALAGQTAGPISGSTASGTASVGASSWVGGLVGLTSGTIAGSTAAVDVTSTQAGSYVGGLAGASSRAISASSASGAVSGGARVGGLVGDFSGSETIQGTGASGATASTAPGASVGGLVGFVGGTAGIANSSASGSVQGGSSTGGLVGYFAPSAGSITGSTASGHVTSTAASADVGGLVGVASGSGSITNSGATGNVTAASNADTTGGLVGELRLTGGIVNSSAGAPGSTVSGGNHTGGVVGWYNQAAALVTDNTKTIAFRGSSVSGGSWVGGLVGQSTGTAALSGLRASADVTASGNAGGVAGYIAGSATDVRASGNVSAGGDAGGLFANAAGSGTITDGAATGQVTSTSNTAQVGGLIGYASGGSVVRGTATGNVTGGRYTGGLIGQFTNHSGAGIRDANASGHVNGSGDAGGLVGFATGSGSLEGSSASGSVHSTDTGSFSAGGAVGYFNLTGGMVGVSSSGNVSGGAYAGGSVGYWNPALAITGASLSSTATSVTGNVYAGGLIGYMQGSAPITGLTSGANVSSGNVAGGLVGRSSSSITGSAASGSVTGGGDAGGLVGRAEGTGALTDVSATGTVGSTGSGHAGGLAGRATSGALLRASAVGAVTSATGSAGGLVGYFSASADIRESGATGNVSGADNVGGLLGQAHGSGGLYDSSATGRVTDTDTGGHSGGLAGYFTLGGGMTNATASGVVSGGSNTGGLVGYASGGTITASHATGGSVSGSGNVGGLVGAAYASITNSSAAATVNGGTAGGLVGTSVSITISDGTASGAVTGNGYAGGLVGYAGGSGTISTSRASGIVTGEQYAGGLVGWTDGGITISGSSASGDVRVVSGYGFGGGLVGRFGYYYYYTPQSINGSAATGNVTVDASQGYAGGLVGYMDQGSIVDSTASGRVWTADTANAGNTSHYAGGLVGYFNGEGISGSTASGGVTGRYMSGGLVGGFSASGSITNSAATGAVDGGQYTGGLAGYFYSSGGTISNSLASGAVAATDGSYVGGLAGYAYAASANLTNVQATGDVAAGSASYAGGLVGYLVGTGVTTGFASGTVSGGWYVGGLVGYATPSRADAWIRDSRASGTVSAASPGGFAGGLVGYYSNSSGFGSIVASAAEGDVSALNGHSYAGGLVGYYYSTTARAADDIRESRASGAVTANAQAGGLVGHFEGTRGIRLSGASGEVTLGQMDDSYAGGLVGHFFGRNADAKIDRSYASGTVQPASGVAAQRFSDNFLGGLAGHAGGSGSVVDSYASGSVQASGSGSAVGSTLRVGGLVGETRIGVTRSYSTGAVAASGAATVSFGGLIGRRGAGTETVSESFWATDASGQASSDGGTGKTLAELKQLATFTGTGSTWSIAGTAGAGRAWRLYEGHATPLLSELLAPADVALADTGKTYDGTTSFGNGSLTGSGGALARPDLVFVDAPSADVGRYTVGASGVYSTQRGYDLTVSGSATLTVDPRPVTLAGVVADKVYDGTRTATLAGTGQPSGLVPGEDLAIDLSAVSAAFDTKDVGTGKTVTVSGYALADGVRGKASNYTLANAATSTASITKAPLTGISFTATGRVYDGSKVVAVSASGGALGGIFGSDDVRVDVGSVTSGTLADKNVGTSKPVTVTGAALTGADAGNYFLADANGLTVNITPRALTANGLVADDRQYDAGTRVWLRTGSAVLSGAVSGDVVELADGGFYGNMVDKNVGTGKSVSASNLRLRGPDAGNYTAQTGAVTVDITPYRTSFYIYRVSGTDRVYDGTADATAASYLYRASAGDDLTLSTDAPTFADKNVAYNSSSQVIPKTITAGNAQLSGSDAANYVLTNTSSTTSGTISPKPLGVTGVTARNRVYDGTRDVTIDLQNASVDLSAKIAGDDLGVQIPSGGTATGQMADKHVGSNKPLTSIPGLALTGADQLNYTLSGTNGVTVDITTRTLTATYTGVDRVYDGSTGVRVIAASADIVSGDSLSFSVNDYYNYYYNCYYYCGTFTGSGAKNVGTNKPVVVNGVFLTGNDSNNYTLTNPDGGTTTASVTPLAITPAFTGVNKVYDGTVDATVTIDRSGSGIFPGDTVASTQTAVYTGSGARNVGTGKAIAVSDVVFSGADAGNYALSANTGTASANITPRFVTLTGINATSRPYDGTTTVAVSAPGPVTSSGFVNGDDVAVQLPGGGLTTGSIADKTVGAARPVTVSGLSLRGNDAPNYLIDSGASGITVDITARPLTATYTGIGRAYNGGTLAQVSGASTDIVPGDTVTFTQDAAYTGVGAANAGTNKPIAVSRIAIAGADALNYALQNTTATASADITAKPLTVHYAGTARDYNGVADVSATVTGSSTDIVAGDVVTFAQLARFRGDGSAGVAKPIDVTNVALGGSSAANYMLTSATATASADIRPKPIGVTGITATDRTYNGSVTVSVNVSSAAVDTSAVIAGDDVQVSLPPGGITTGSMLTKDAGAAKPVEVTGLAISGNSAANYRLVGASGLAVDIAPKAVTALYSGLDKVYDGTTATMVTASSGDFEAVDVGAVGISAQGVFTGGKDVGLNKVVAVGGGFVTGAERGNYTLLNPTGQAAASITPKTITPNYVGDSRVYDGGTAAPVTAQRNGIVVGDDVGFAQVAVFTGAGAKNVGSAKPIDVSAITLTGGDAGNYLLSRTTDSAWGTVTPKPITVGGLGSVTATSRVYDGTRIVEVVIPSGTTLTPNSADVVAGDDVGFAVPGAGTTTGTMADKRVGTGKAVAISGLALSGTDAPNYTIAGTAGVTVDISPLAVTANYVGVSKVYDGTPDVSVSGSAPEFIAGDAVGITGGGVFTGTGAKNVGSAKPIQVTGAQLAGSDALNYLLTNPTGSASGDITPRPVTPSYAGLSRVYDGTTAAPVAASVGDFVQGDDVRLTQTAEFTGPAAKDAGTGKPVAVGGITLTGGDAGNYALTASSASTTGTVTRRPVTLLNFTAAMAVDRVYDGTTGVAVNVASTGTITPTPGDLIPGDDVQVQVPSAGTTTGTMVDKHAGTAKPVAVTGLGLAGSDAHNYMLSAAGGVTVNIGQRPLTATYAGVAKIYDGSAAATVTGASSDLIAGDVLTIAGSGVYTDGKNTGTAKPIEVRSATLSGADAANYLLGNPTGSATGDVDRRIVTPAYVGGTRVYDGTVAAPVAGSLTGLVAGDAVTLAETAVFTGAGARNVGSDKPVSVTGIAIAGTDAGNYDLTTTSATTTADVTPRPVGITGLTGITATDRVYDGTRSVAITIAGGGQPGLDPADLVAGDDVTIGSITPGTTTGTMVDKHVGNNKAVAVDGLTLGGVDAPNYVITGTAGVSVTITPRPVTASYGSASKVYDGTNTIVVFGSSADVIAGDLLTITGTGVFSDGKAAGNGKAIVVSGGALGGADAGNYLLAGGNTTTGNITPRPLTFDYLGGTRIYDGGVTAPVTGALGGVIAGDSVDLTQTAAFVGAGARNVGVNKPVAVSAIALTGGDAGNYSLGATTASTTATVLPKPLTISGLAGIVAADRVYDGTPNVDLTIGSIGSITGDVVPGDDVVIGAPGGGAGAGTMLDKHVGSAKPVVVSGLTLSGADAGNYVVGTAQGVTVNISARAAPLTGLVPIDRVYDGTVAVAIDSTAGALGGTIAGDDVRVATSGVTGTIADKSVGSGRPVTLSGFALAGSDAGNYTVVTGALGVNIVHRPLAIGATVPDRYYDGTLSAAVNFTDDRIPGDQLSLTAANAAFADRSAGTAKSVTVGGLSLVGADAGNYRLPAGTLALTGNVVRAPLAVTARDQTKIYGDTFTFTGTEFVSSGLVAGESIGQVTLTSPGAAATAGVTMIPYAITPSAPRSGTFDLANYELRLVDGALQVQPRPLTVIADSLVRYPNDTRILGASTNVGGLVNGDTLAGVQLAVPPESATAPGGSVYPITPSGGSLATGSPANYAVSYASGLLVIVPQPPQIGQGSAGGSGDLGFAIVVSPEEVAAAQLELARTAGALGQTTAEAGRGEIASRRAGSLRQLSPDEAESIASRIAAEMAAGRSSVDLPTLQRMPLITLDAPLRRLILGSDAVPPAR